MITTFVKTRLIACFGVSLLLLTQTAGVRAQLTQKLDELSKLVPSSVLVGQDNFSLSMSYEQQAPYSITITTTEEGARGEDEVVDAVINLGLIKRVKYTTGRQDKIYLLLNAGGVPSIKILEDGELDGYEEKFELLAADVNNARDMEALIEEILPMAKAAWEQASQLPTSKSELEQYIAGKVSAASGREVTEQQLEFIEEGAAFALSVEKGDDVVVYTTYVEDIDDRKSKLRERSGAIQYQLEIVRNQEFVEKQENDKRKFVDGLSIKFDEFDDGILFLQAIEKLVPIAREEAKTLRPKPASLSAAMSELSTGVGTGKSDEVSQTLEGECAAVYGLEENSRESMSYTFAFDFADVNANAIRTSSDDGFVEVVLPTGRDRDYVAMTEDGELKKYVDQVRLKFATVPAAKRGVLAAEYLAETCPKEVVAPAQEALLKLLEGSEFGGTLTTQSAELDDSRKCGMIVTQSEEGRRSTEELQHEFNLYDLNKKSGRIDVDRTLVKVEFKTVKNEDVIQTLKNEEDQRYYNEIAFWAKDIQEAKMIHAGVEAWIGRCEE